VSGSGLHTALAPFIGPPSWFRFAGTQRTDRRLAVVAQQFSRLIEKLPAMLGPCTLVAPPQRPQRVPELIDLSLLATVTGLLAQFVPS